jgi:hypothetical protein
MKDSRAPLFVAIVLLVLPVLYVVSYLALVKPRGVLANAGSAGCYRIGGEFSATLYWPLEKVDRQLRPRDWDPWSTVNEFLAQPRPKP